MMIMMGLLSDKNTCGNTDYRSIRIIIVLLVFLMITALAEPVYAAGAGHKHKYRLRSVKCTAGVKIYVCKKCGKIKKKKIKKRKHQMIRKKSGYYTVEKCRRCGKTKKYLTRKIPSYWSKNIVHALETAKSRAEMPGYVFVTDPHWAKSAKHSPAIVSYVTKQMDYPFAVCGGDVIAGHQTSHRAAVHEIQSFFSKFTVPVLSVAGNHDDNSNSNDDSSSYLSEEEVENMFYASAPAGTDVQYNGRFAYIDDTVNRIRYITFFYDDLAAVPAEITDRIDEKVCELDSDWDVILFSHAYWHHERPGTENEPKRYGTALAARLLKIQKKSDADIVLWHTGHIHRDKHVLLTDPDGTQLLVVSTNCDTYMRSAPWGGLDMKKGTNKEHVIEIVQIDKCTDTVYMTRIGAGSSRTFPAEEPVQAEEGIPAQMFDLSA